MVDIRKDILLNECGDFAIVDGDLAIVDGVDQIRQSWLIHIRTLLGELLTNINDGVPWFQTILDKHSDLTAVEQIFFDETLKVPGILNVEGVEIEAFDLQARIWEITVTCTCEGEEGSQVFHYQGSMPVGTCTGTLAEDLPLSVDGLIVWFDAQDLGNLTYDPTVPYLRLENKGGEGYALAVGNGPELLIDGDMEAGPGVEEFVDGDMEDGPGSEELVDGDMEAGPGSELFVDGDMEEGPGSEDLTDGDMEAGPGSEELTDGDMEAADTSAWTAGNSATLSKVTGTPHGGIRSLRVAYNGVANPYAYQSVMTTGRSYHIEGWARGDGSIAPQVQEGATVLWTGTLSSSWQNFSVDFVATSTEIRFYALAAAGGNCDFDDVSVKETCPAWDPRNSALLTKETTFPHGGTQCLRITYNGTNNPGADQGGAFVSGRSTRLTGWARGDGTYNPFVRIGANTVWTGTSSTTWQNFDLTLVAPATDLRLQGNCSGAGHVDYDDVSAVETCPAWSEGNNALLRKFSLNPRSGIYNLRVEYDGTASPYAYQTIVTSGKSYNITGWAKGDGTYVPSVQCGATVLWTGTSSVSWQFFDIDFVSGATDIRLYSNASAAGTCGFDDVSVKETCPAWISGNSALLTKIVGILSHGGTQSLRADYNGTNNPYAYQSIMTTGRSYHIEGWAKGDGTYAPQVQDGATTLWTGTSSTAWQNFSIDFLAGSTEIRFYSLATGSGYCEFDDASLKETCPDWISGSSALLTKETTTPHGGSQLLRVAYTGSSFPYAEQSIMITGRTYQAIGWARSDGTYTPRLREPGGTTHWVGTTSTSWQNFDVSFVAGGTDIALYAGATGAGYCEFDDCSLKETCPDWTPLNSPTLTKETTAPHGEAQCMRIASNGTGSEVAYQVVTTIGKNYQITGWARTQGSSGNAAAVRDGTIAWLWTGTVNETSWEYFDIVFTAQSTQIRLYNRYAASGYVEFDDVSVTEGGGGFPELVGVSSLNQKRSVYFDNTVANFNRSHLAFFDTKALRTAGQDYAVFCVFRLKDDAGVGNYDYGLISFRGQNDAGTSEECQYLSMIEDGSVPGDPDIIAYQRNAITFTNSKASLTAADPFDSFYAMVEFLDSAITNFYYNGVAEAGDNTLAVRKLDGDGFIGAAIGSDRETPEKFAYGYFGEILVYEGKLSVTEIATINAYLAAKWGF